MGEPTATPYGLRSSDRAIQHWRGDTDRDPWLYFTLSDDERERKTPPVEESRQGCTRGRHTPDRDRHDFRQGQASGGVARQLFPDLANEYYDALLR